MQIMLVVMTLLTLSTRTFGSTLKIKFENLSSDKGELHYILFNDDSGFPDKEEKAYKKGSLPVVKARSEGLSITELLPGKYAFSVIHDENSNGKLDTNFLGIPTEDFGFSNNPTVLFGPPGFSNCSFELRDDREIVIKMKGF